MFTKPIENDESGNLKKEEFKDDKNVYREKDLLILFIQGSRDNNQSKFIIHENLGIGSQMEISFLNKIKDYDESQNDSSYRYAYHRMDYSRNKYLVRDIPISERSGSLYVYGYFNIIWNFQSPQSDQILNISRDKLIKKTERKFINVFEGKILPKALVKFISFFEQANTSNTNKNIAIEYFHLELTAMIYKINCKHLNEIYKDYEISDGLLVDQNFKSVKFRDFFQMQKSGSCKKGIAGRL